MNKWVIRKCTRCDVEGGAWHVYDPDGFHSGDFASWDLAIDWVMDPTWRIEHYLATRGLDES